MKTKYFEYITVYLSVFLVCIFIGAIARFVLIEMGADEYTAGVFFWISTGFGILMFAILSLFLNDLTERLLNRFLKAKKNESSESRIPGEDLEKIEEERHDVLIKSELSENKKSARDIQQIREEQQNAIKNQKQARIDIAIRYAEQQFALYVADDDLKQLGKNLIIYAEDINFENIKPVKVKDLSNLDLYHFGWNIWNCFKVSRQDRAAQFLKLTFADALKDVEENSIKTHLKDDELKGLIKIMEDFTDF
jgi:membrane protein implicated in regulation of membrane protease activity